jgi:C4-dicarboxylate-specific signal transduction histidine kinase
LKDLCHEKFKNNNVDLEFSGVEKNLCVKTRATQLLQVLFNLVSNSSDAIKNFETKWINVILDSDDQFVYIRIVDSGKGIDQVVLKKIFNPFFTTKDIGEGTGIGLSISRQMIADQGGKLVYDQYNGNTSFLITLKRA